MENISQLPLENNSEPILETKNPLSSKIITSLLVTVAFILVGFGSYSLGLSKASKNNVAVDPQPKSSPIASPVPEEEEVGRTMDAMENPELYVDKDKAIAFLYPNDTHLVTIDGEVEYARTTSSGIPNSFIQAKGYSPPEVIWALKVEEKKMYQGRYGDEFPLTPFAVWVFDNTQLLSISEWFNKYWYYPFTWGNAVQTELDKMEPVAIGVIDEKQAYGYNAGPTPRGYLKLVYVSQGARIYLFQLLGEESTSLEDQIMASFKFLMPE